MKEMNLSEDELDQVAGGIPKYGGGESANKRVDLNHAACAFIGVGVGLKKRTEKRPSV